AGPGRAGRGPDRAPPARRQIEEAPVPRELRDLAGRDPNTTALSDDGRLTTACLDAIEEVESTFECLAFVFRPEPGCVGLVIVPSTKVHRRAEEVHVRRLPGQPGVDASRDANASALCQHKSVVEPLAERPLLPADE